jgi:hypothetical protein
MKARVPTLREHSEQVLSVKSGFLGKLTKPAMDLGHITDGK